MSHISVGILCSIQFAFVREHVSVFKKVCLVVGIVKDHRASTREYLICVM